MFRRLIALIVCACTLSLFGCSGRMSTKQIESTLEEYMQAVYAPQSMDQFNKAKEDSSKLFTQYVTDRFFVAYGNELTEQDLKRVCETYITHGKAENQSDGRERFLITAYLYPYKGADAEKYNFTFIMNSDGLVDDFTIEPIA